MDISPYELLNNFTEIINDDGTDGPRRCILRIDEILKEAGVPTGVIAKESTRPILYAKLRSRLPKLSPLLLYASVGGAAVNGDSPIIEALKDGRVRSLSPEGLKGGAALFSSVMQNVKQEKARLPFDLILLITGGTGLKQITEKHPALLKDVKYAIGENGGFPMFMGQKKICPIMIAEKQVVRLRITAKNGRTSAVSKIARAIIRLENKKLPVRPTEPVRLMTEALGKALGEIDEIMMSLMLKPISSRTAVKLMGKEGRFFAPLIRNTVSINVLRGGDNVETIPESVYVDMDTRLVPGVSVGECVSDIRSVIGDGYDIDLVRGCGTGQELDMTLFCKLTESLTKRDHDALPIPYVNAHSTDGRFLTEMGIQTYGFAPINLPVNSDMGNKSKSAVRQARSDAMDFGLSVLMQFLLERDE